MQVTIALMVRPRPHHLTTYAGQDITVRKLPLFPHAVLTVTIRSTKVKVHVINVLKVWACLGKNIYQKSVEC